MAPKAIHPGEYLARELEERSMSVAELAQRLKIPAANVADILNGRSAITVDLAVQFAHVFDTSARFWLDLQSLYDLSRTERKTTVTEPYPRT